MARVARWPRWVPHCGSVLLLSEGTVWGGGWHRTCSRPLSFAAPPPGPLRRSRYPAAFRTSPIGGARARLSRRSAAANVAWGWRGDRVAQRDVLPQRCVLAHGDGILPRSLSFSERCVAPSPRSSRLSPPLISPVEMRHAVASLLAPPLSSLSPLSAGRPPRHRAPPRFPHRRAPSRPRPPPRTTAPSCRPCGASRALLRIRSIGPATKGWARVAVGARFRLTVTSERHAWGCVVSLGAVRGCGGGGIGGRGCARRAAHGSPAHCAQHPRDCRRDPLRLICWGAR